MPEKTTEDFLVTARKRFEQAAADEKPLRDEATADLRFVVGDHWDPKLKQARLNAGRPVLTFNRCHTFVQQVSNEARQNKPQIKFSPREDGDVDTAEVFEGLARFIQSDPNATLAYETAAEYAAGGSFGYFRFLTDYADDEGFDLDLKVVPVPDPMAVYGILLPTCLGQEPKFAFVVEDIPLEEYKNLYGEENPVDFSAVSAKYPGWCDGQTVRVAEYWYIEEETVILKKGDRERVVRRPTVKFCKMNGVDVIKDTTTTWPGKTIPIIAVAGKQIIVDGKPQLFSVVRFQRDPQQLINFYKTRIAETLGTAPIQPYLVAEGVTEGYEKEWETLNTTLRPYLPYKVIDAAGKPLPPPQRQVFEPPIQSLSVGAGQEIDDMKATAGIYDASLGAKSNETSGRAIFARQQQGTATNMHFMDNLERAFSKGGAIMADVMPKIYDGSRAIRILGKDETPKIVKINQPLADGKHYRLGGEGVGKYDVVVTMGRSFSTKRMETFDMMTQVLRDNQGLLPMIGDIFFQNSDIAGSDILAARFKKMLPPNLQDGDPNDPNNQLQALQGKLAQTGQQLQAIDAFAAQLQKEKEAKVVEAQSKAQIAQMQEQTRLEIVKLQEATKLAVAQINASKDANQAFAERELEQYKLLHGSAHELGMQAQEQAHEKQLADQQAQTAADAQAAQQGHEMTMQEQAAQSQEGDTTNG